MITVSIFRYHYSRDTLGLDSLTQCEAFLEPDDTISSGIWGVYNHLGEKLRGCLSKSSELQERDEEGDIYGDVSYQAGKFELGWPNYAFFFWFLTPANTQMVKIRTFYFLFLRIAKAKHRLPRKPDPQILCDPIRIGR